MASSVSGTLVQLVGLVTVMTACQGFLHDAYQEIDPHIHQCKNFYRSKKIGCVNRTFTGSDKVSVQCRVHCTVMNVTDVTICKTTYLNITERHILGALPTSTQKLIIVYDNSWAGYLPQGPGPVDLTLLARLKNLTLFYLTARSRAFTQLYPLQFDPESLQQITNMERLAIRMPIKASNPYSGNRVIDMVQQFPKLKHVDFSYTRGIGYDSVKEILSVLNASSVEHLCFKLFQLPGGVGYHNTLNLSKDFTKQFPQLKEMDVSYNALTLISPGISTIAKNLKRIDISGNMLLDSHNMAFLAELVLHPQIQILNANYQGYETCNPEDVTDDTKSAKPTEKQLEILKVNFFKFVGTCVTKVSQGNISNIANNSTMSCEFLKCILPLEFSGYDCATFTLLPPFNTIYNPDCMMNVKIPIGKHLKRVHFSHIHWENAELVGVSTNGTLCFDDNNLETLDIAGNSEWSETSDLPKSIQGAVGIKGLDNIQVLNVTNNSFSIDIDNILRNAPEGKFHKLKYLDISGNNVSLSSNSSELCRYMPNLSHLHMQRVGLIKIPYNVISGCANLKEVYLGINQSNIFFESKGNETYNFDLNFTGTDNLQYLDLSNNGINFLDKSFRNKLDAYGSNLTINLRDNPLQCVCPHDCPGCSSFIQWLINNKKRLVNFTDYYCTGPGGKKKFLNGTDFEEIWRECQDFITLPMLLGSIAAVIIFFMLLVLIFVCIKYRWRIRHKVYQMQSCLGQRRKKDQDAHRMWKYDTYISFVNADVHWVKEVLVRKLEYKYDFAVCLLDKEQNMLSDVISNEMSKSRHIIIILSAKALQSEWFQFELNEAVRQINKSGGLQKLIVIKLGKITDAKLFGSPKLEHILDRHQFLVWGMTLFWSTLQDMLYYDAKFTCCACCFGKRKTSTYRSINSHQELAFPYDEHENENIDEMPQEARQHWLAACAARAAARKADSYIKELRSILQEGSRLPDWVYGPTPVGISQMQVVRNHSAEIDKLVSTHAREKVCKLIKFLELEKETEAKRCVREEQKCEQIKGADPTHLNIHA